MVEAERTAEKNRCRSCATAAAGILPLVFYKYEQLCKWVYSEPVHNLPFFLTTFFCGPAGLYIWESAEGGWFRRAWRGMLAWAILGIGALLFFVGFGWVMAIVLVPLGWPLHFLLKWTRIARRRPAPEVPRELTFKFGYLDVASLLFVGFIFLVMAANRDDLLRIDMVYDSDPTYHMAVARQIIEQEKVPAWDRWEYAPFGRPHLYPPLLHRTIAFFAGSADNVLFGFNTLQILLFPLSLLLGWYFARWLFGAAGGFATVIILSMGTSFLISQAMVLPAAVATALLPAILTAFLGRRTAAVVIMLGVSFYVHLGMPFMIMLGLLVLSVRYREYFPFFRKVTAFTGLFYLPWVFRTLPYLSWLGSSTGAMAGDAGLAMKLVVGLLQLMIVNPVLMTLAGITWFRDKDGRLGPVKCMLVGFLPMLFSYGGRYFMHTWPLWAVLAGRMFQKWLERGEAKATETGTTRPLKRRVALLYAFSLVPFPVLMAGMPGKLGFGLMPGVTGTNSAIGVAAWQSSPDTDFVQLADFIRRTLPAEPVSGTPPPPDDPRAKPENYTYMKYMGSDEYAALRRRIVHVGTPPYGSLYFGDRLVAATGCRVDTGGWGPEVRSELMRREVERARAESDECLFAFFKKEKRKVKVKGKRKEEPVPFSDAEIDSIRTTNRLEWVRCFGGRYLVGGRGMAPAE